MSYPSTILIDSSVLLAYYNARDHYHQPAKRFFENCHSNLLTTIPCITEVMYLLDRHWQVQNHFLQGVNLEVFAFVPLLPEDLLRIAELNEKYSDLPGDFADLSLVAISERLNIAAIATLDDDFYVYQRYRKQPFDRISLT